VPASAPDRAGTIPVLRVASLAQAVDDLGLRPVDYGRAPAGTP